MPWQIKAQLAQLADQDLEGAGNQEDLEFKALEISRKLDHWRVEHGAKRATGLWMPGKSGSTLVKPLSKIARAGDYAVCVSG